jgi:hypothetical protein
MICEHQESHCKSNKNTNKGIKNGFQEHIHQLYDACKCVTAQGNYSEGMMYSYIFLYNKPIPGTF